MVWGRPGLLPLVAWHIARPLWRIIRPSSIPRRVTLKTAPTLNEELLSLLPRLSDVLQRGMLMVLQFRSAATNLMSCFPTKQKNFHAGDIGLQICVHIIDSYLLLDTEKALADNLPSFAAAMENLLGTVPLSSLNLVHNVR